MAKYRLRFRHTLKDLVSTEEGRDAKTQCKAYGVNRYVFLLIAVYTMVTLGRFMWAYPSFYDMFLRAGAYAWLCDGSAPQTLVRGLPEHVTCEARNMAINAVLLTAVGSTFIGSIMAAATNVALGGKLCSMLGAGSMFAGMLLVGYSSRAFRAYVPGAVLVGLGMDFVVFPSFNATLLFPNLKLLITSVLTSSISVGMFLPMLMNHLVWERDVRFEAVMLGYALLSAGVLFVLFMLFYPPRRFYEQKEIDDAFHLSCVESQLADPYDLGPLGARRASSKSEGPGPAARFLALFGISVDKAELLKRSLLSPHFFLAAAVYAIVSIASSYYVSISGSIHSHTDRWYLSIGIGSSFVISLLISPFIDRLGTMFVMWYEAVCLLPSLVLAMLPHEAPKMLSIVLYSMFTAYSNAQIWLFVVETFDTSINTLVLGILNIVAGVFTLGSSEAYQRIFSRYESMYGVSIAANVLAGVLILLVLALQLRKIKQNRIE